MAVRVLALSGGVGGAKLALGLADVLPPGALDVLVNTGDDFEHLGLHISPDIDTLLYTLSGLANRAQGWGIEGDTFQAMAALERLGGATWFRLGDRDLATHLWRTQRLDQGADLCQVTAELASSLGLAARIHPMSADRVRTTVDTERGPLAFQHYFVREACAPAVTGFRFEGLGQARPNGDVMAGLAVGAFDAVIICPSNPFVSIDPILQLPGLWQALADSAAPVALVSPIVGGLAIKGPAAKMMAELGVPATALGVAAHYAAQYPGLVDHFVLDQSDATLCEAVTDLGMAAAVAATVMHDRQEKQRLARQVLALMER